MQGRGFEPLKAEPAGLQPAPFGHSGTPAGARHCSRARRVVPTIAGWSASTSSSSAPGRPARRRRSTSRAPARACCSSTRRASRATSRAAAGSPAARFAQLPCDVDAGRRARRRPLRAPAPLRRRSFERAASGAADPDDAAAPARRVPRRAGGRGRRDFRDGIRVERPRARTPTASRRTVGGASRARRRRSSAPTAPTGSSRRRSGSARGSSAASRSRGTSPWGALDRERVRAARAVVELGVVPAATAGCSRRATTRTSASAAGRAKGRACASISTRLARAHGIDRDALTDVRGHRLPMRRARRQPAARGRVLLVGDAAGLVDPLSGDGMYEAFVSARLAADGRSLAGASRERRTSRARRSARPTTPAASWAAKRALDRYPRRLLLARRAARRLRRRRSGCSAATCAHPSEARGLARPPLARCHAARALDATPSGC